MTNAVGQKTVVIPRCDERVIQDIELNPNHDDLAVKTIRREVEALLPKERPGGLVG